jgi:hypothetical protein
MSRRKLKLVGHSMELTTVRQVGQSPSEIKVSTVSLQFSRQLNTLEFAGIINIIEENLSYND